MQTSDKLVWTRGRRAARRRLGRLGRGALVVTLALQAAVLTDQAATQAMAETAPAAAPQIVPVPVAMVAVPGETFVVGPGTRIVVAPDAAETLPVADDL